MTKTQLNSFDFSEDETPFLDDLLALNIRPKPSRKKFVVSESNEHKAELVDKRTGVIFARDSLAIIEPRDDAEFVKIFPESIYMSTKLSVTAQRVFNAIIEEYSKSDMSRGYAVDIYLKYYNGGLNGGRTDRTKMSKDTFYRGMRELIEKRFIAPRRPDIYWVNPTVIFKGNRARYVTELKNKKRKGVLELHNFVMIERLLQMRDVHYK